jgi:hypothetical protein
VAIEDAKAATDAAKAQVAQIEATIADMTLKRRDVAEYSAGHHREFDAAVCAAVNSRLCHHVLLSGSFTPFESMPVFLQDIMYILPLDALRAICPIGSVSRCRNRCRLVGSCDHGR